MIIHLPFQQPWITHVPFDNCLLGILQNFTKSYDWIFSNYLNSYINKKTGADYFYPKFMWKVCPFIEKFTIPYFMVKQNFETFTDFLLDCFAKDFYVYAVVNVKHIKEYYSSISDDHNPIFIGIDTDKKVINMCDFFSNGIYREIDCSYDEVNASFESLEDCYNDEYIFNDCSEITILRYNPAAEFNFDWKDFSETIKEYSSSQNLLSKNRNTFMSLEDNDNTEFYWGLESWDYIYEGNQGYIMRHFSFLVAHSRMWKLRYNYFISREFLKPIQELEVLINIYHEKTVYTLNHYLKHKLQNIQDFSKLNPILYECIELEQKICKMFLDVEYKK